MRSRPARSNRPAHGVPSAGFDASHCCSGMQTTKTSANASTSKGHSRGWRRESVIAMRPTILTGKWMRATTDPLLLRLPVYLILAEAREGNPAGVETAAREDRPRRRLVLEKGGRGSPLAWA